MSRILFFVNHLRDGAGMIHRVMGLSKELARLGHETSILQYFEGDSQWSKESGIPCDTLVRTRYRWWLYENPIVYPFVLFFLFFKFLSHRPEWVFCELHHEAFLSCLLRPIFGFKVVYTYHGVADEKFYEGSDRKSLGRIRRKSHKMLQRADRVIIVSDFLRSEVEKQGVAAVTIYNGLEPIFLEGRSSKSKEDKEIIFIGRFTEYKGAISIIEAYSKVKHEMKGVKLVLHGFKERPEYLEKMEALIKSEGLTEVCEIRDPLRFEEVPKRLRSAIMFVNGSLDETFGMPLLEAQGCGLPVVAFKAGGIPEVVIHGKTGLLAEPGNTEMFGKYMLNLVRDENLRQTLTSNIPAHVERFSYSNLAEELEASVIRNA